MEAQFKNWTPSTSFNKKISEFQINFNEDKIKPFFVYSFPKNIL